MNEYMKQIRKINIYENCVDTTKPVVSTTIRYMVKKGIIKHMRPVEHNGKKYPVTMILDDFSNYDWSGIIDMMTDNRSSLEKILSTNKTKEELFIDNFYREEFRQLLGYTISVSCGAESAAIGISKRYAEFFGEEPGNPADLIYGFVILVDKRITKITNQIDEVIHHEYFHTMVRGGKLEKAMESLSLDIDQNPNFCKFSFDCTEERACDAFAKCNTGKTLHVYPMMKWSHDLVSGIKTKSGAGVMIDFVTRCLRFATSKPIAYLSILIQGRKI